MVREVPIALQDHLETGQTTLTKLYRFDPVTPGIASYGVTELDIDVVYDDGVSELSYLSSSGMSPANLMQSSDISVNNSEGRSLLTDSDIPIDEADIRAGVLDNAVLTVMLVNYADLSQGHVVLFKGTAGQVTMDANGLSYVTELRGLSATMKQSVCQKDSLSCRAIFGSMPDSSTPSGTVKYRFPCGFDATTLLTAFTVNAVGVETTRTFDISGGGLSVNQLVPGLVMFTTGLNAGREFEVEANDPNTITLAYETPFPIQNGDQGFYREDCSKQARDDDKGCRHWFGADWVLHFRGEPDIPIGDAGAMETPGASSGPGSGGATRENYEAE